MNRAVELFLVIIILVLGFFIGLMVGTNISTIDPACKNDSKVGLIPYREVRHANK